MWCNTISSYPQSWNDTHFFFNYIYDTSFVCTSFFTSSNIHVCLSILFLLYFTFLWLVLSLIHAPKSIYVHPNQSSFFFSFFFQNTCISFSSENDPPSFRFSSYTWRGFCFLTNRRNSWPKNVFVCNKLWMLVRYKRIFQFILAIPQRRVSFHRGYSEFRFLNSCRSRYSPYRV